LGVATVLSHINVLLEILRNLTISAVLLKMRFVNTSAFQLQDVPDSEVREFRKGYVVLSHRWKDEEVTFEDMMSRQHFQDKRGYAKLEGFCKLVCSMGYDFV
jgi:hypothetical protein